MRYNEITESTNQIISELFLSNVEWELESDRKNMKKYTFSIDAVSYWVGLICRPNSNDWCIVFDIESEHDNNFKATGMGNAAMVLSTVVSICKSFISNQHPDTFVFEAKLSEISRVSLYRRMTNTLIKTIPYTYSQAATKQNMVFTLTKD